jgi:hypothetical protein
MEAHLRGMNLVLPADSFVDAFVRDSEAHFYTPGYLNELIPAIAAAVDSGRAAPSMRDLCAAGERGADLGDAIGQVVSRVDRSRRSGNGRARS